MEHHFITKILTLLSMAVAVSHAALSSSPMVSYWNSELPNTPMPQAIKDSLAQTSEWLEEEGTSVAVGKGGVNVNTGKGKPGGGTNVNVGHGSVGVNAPGKPGAQGTNVGVGKGGVSVHAGGKPGGQGTNVGVGKGGVNVHTGGKPGRPGTTVGVGKGGVSVGTGGKHGKPVVVNVGPSPFVYNYAAKEDQLHDNPNVALFFKPTALHKGAAMDLHFTKTANNAVFLPRTESEKIPFSSQNLPQILRQFSVKPGSDEAQAMEQTIKECEDPAIKGEEKKCATSLESMIDFSKTKLGKEKNIKPLSTETAAGAGETSPVQKYTISGVEKINGGDNRMVVCHKQNYAYAVFYCHKTETTDAFAVSLVGANGAKVRAAAVCHKDTSAWNPKHLAFQVLKVKAGTVPVCHFLPEDHVVWVAHN